MINGNHRNSSDFEGGEDDIICLEDINVENNTFEHGESRK